MSIPNEKPQSTSSGTSTPSWDSRQRSGHETPMTDATDEDYGNNVAVIGMACRVSGGNNSPDDLWQTILNKLDTSSEIPAKRWEPYYRRDVRNAKVLDQTTKRGYFLDNLEGFDASFFGVSPKEAEQMDPQQRISLEVTWEALENAGIAPQSLSGSDTAVFMGVNSDDYSKLLLEDLPKVEPWMGIGTAYCGVPNRISYHLNLMGPSTAVDAACASSLVAIHHGAQAILCGEAKVAIAGGVNALCGPGLTSVLDKAGATSKEGRCRSFDDSANGYGRGEGAAVVILKRMSDAIRENDNIIAVLRGTAVAQDGKTKGIMAPNAKAQELVARKALSVAKIEPSTVQYVEAHATSTSLGDPTEVAAISSVYGQNRDGPCFLGSVKPNIGHLEAGAGVCGFIKAAMAVNKGILPPQANLTKLNTRIDWAKSGVQVLQDTLKWPESDQLRRAGICSYGYGGTVSHAVIEQYLKPDLFPLADQDIVYEDRPSVLLLSAPQEKRLAIQANTQHAWISSTGKGHSLQSIATTLNTRRGHHDYRAAFAVDSHDDAADAFKAFKQGSANEWTASGRVLPAEVRKDVVWVFSGHGAQWTNMAKELIENRVFYDTVSSVDQIIKEEMGFSAVEALESGDFETSIQVQVLTYVMQVGLVAVLRSKGIVPDAVIGHSVGEVAASVTAGALTLEEGALIVTRRARLYKRVQGLGAMVLANLPPAEIRKELDDQSGLAIAIESSPSSCVVSGPRDGIEAFVEALKAKGTKCFRVKSDIAFHHPQLEDLRDGLTHALTGSLAPQAADVPLYSTSLSNPRGDNLRDVSYWIDNMTKPVRLTSAVEAALEDGYRLFLEVSSHQILAHSINETLMDQGIEDYCVASTMSRNKPAEKTILLSLAQLHCRGANVNWKAHSNGVWATEVPITTWSHRDSWRHIETGPLNVVTTHAVDKHTLLGQRTAVAGEPTVLYTTRIHDQTKPFPGSHPLHGSEIVPAAALVNTFIHGTGTTTLSNIVLRVPVAISQPRDIQVVVTPSQVKICSRLVQDGSAEQDDALWLTHTTGQWVPANAVVQPLQTLDIESIKARIKTRLADNHSIEYLDKVGVSAMGFPWVITEHLGNLKEMIARVDVAPDVATGADLPWDAYSWAPIFDGATSVGSTIFFDKPALRMPAYIERVTVYSQDPPPKIGYLYVEEATNTQLAVHVSVCGEDGAVLAKFHSMRFSEIEGTIGVSGSVESLVHQLAWPPATYSEQPLKIKKVVLVSSDLSLSKKYSQSLAGRVESVIYLNSAEQLSLPNNGDNFGKDTAIVYVPGSSPAVEQLQAASESYIFELLHIVKFVVNNGIPTKVFVLTDRVSSSESQTALAQSPLHGLTRIIASEHPDIWGSLIDLEAPIFPFETMKYVRDADNIRIIDGIPRVAMLRSFPRERLLPTAEQNAFNIRPEGTYLITGGLGALGLEVADFLVEKGARRLILVSRRSLPPRSQWTDAVASGSPVASAIRRIMLLESQGAVIYSMAVDISLPTGVADLRAAMTSLPFPPVLGVVHAAGVLEDELVLETTVPSFHRVLAPKVSGTMALHAVFPVRTLDFMMLFSSCGQLFGFPGQASYASGNAFLDALATHRRSQGDNTMAIQWTSWRGLGMAASTDFINAELASKGITDVTRDEAFRAWMHIVKYDMDHAVVLRSLALEAGEPLPSPILASIAPRKQATATASSIPTTSVSAIPTTLPERRAYVDERIRECVAKVLHIGSSDEVDSKAPLSDLGVDSVMTVSLRGQLQKSLGVKVPPTLTWSCPTVSHLVGWFMEKVGDSNTT